MQSSPNRSNAPTAPDTVHELLNRLSTLEATMASMEARLEDVERKVKSHSYPLIRMAQNLTQGLERLQRDGIDAPNNVIERSKALIEAWTKIQKLSARAIMEDYWVEERSVKEKIDSLQNATAKDDVAIQEAQGELNTMLDFKQRAMHDCAPFLEDN